MLVPAAAWPRTYRTTAGREPFRITPNETPVRGAGGVQARSASATRAGSIVGLVTAAAEPVGVSASPFAPFRHRAFFWLWLGVVVASIGLWGQTVGAQWLFINDPNAATIVPLVQTASMLPMMLLALPAGVLADVFDRRWLMVVIQIYFSSSRRCWRC